MKRYFLCMEIDETDNAEKALNVLSHTPSIHILNGRRHF